MTTLDEFLAAERAQESGGNYKVVNSIGAMGAYQIMPANLPSWSKAALGHPISEQEFLSHPDEQDAIARYELGPKFEKYGAAGAAAWWYSGQTDPTKTYGNPPVYKYVQEVLARIGKSGSVTGGTPSGSTPSGSSSSGSVQQAGLQQAGYEAVVNLTPWGIPLNPFKLPGYIAGKLGEGLGEGLGDAGGAVASGIWDAIGPLILSTLAVGTGAVLLVLGLYVTVKPHIDQQEQKIESALPAMV